MTDAADIADDYLYFDGVQTVTLRTLAGSSASVAGVTTKPISYKQMMMLGGIAPESTLSSFSLAKAACSALVPRQDCQIVDAAGIIWDILSVELKTFGTRYVCACTKSVADESAPLPPQAVANNSSGGGVLRLTWTNRNSFDTGLSGSVMVSASSSFTSPTSFSVSSVSGASITFSNALAAGTYYVRVKHTNTIGDSPWSAVISVTVGA